jgi:phospholipid/cholesterol/gamma-HCH transport system substrate-binding protein
MTESRTLEIVVGAFVLLGLLAVLALSMQVSNLTTLAGSNGYEVTVKFDNIGGLKVRSPVKMAGVQIGRVSSIKLDGQTYQADVTLDIERKYNKIPTDTSAKIYTAGLLGEQYISLEAGGDDEYLKQGSEITLVSNAVVLEQVISQFLYSKAADKK